MRIPAKWWLPLRSAATLTATASIPRPGLVFAACREGLVSVLHQDSADKYSAVGNITTQFGTRTMTLDPKTHHVFTETADFKAAGQPTPDNPRPRPQPIEGSFVILELAQ